MKTKKLFFLLLTCFFASTVSATIHTVNSGGYYYAPSSLSINLGDTVEWINDGGNHDVNADINTQTGTSFNNPVSFQSNATAVVGAIIYTHIFTVPGTYSYDCSVYGHAASGMTGVIVVNSNNSIYDIVSNSADHTTLKAAVDACGLDGVLSGSGPFTLFAPTDAAFNALPSGTVAALLNNLPQLTDILKHHVVADSVMSGMLSNNQVVTTLLGTDVTVTISNGMVYIDNAMVTVADIVADNGVVHVIDAVLLPNFDCNGIVNGSSMIDTCGVCQQSYIYNYVTHAVTMLNDTFNVTLGSNEILVIANDPSNPYWNSSCVSNSIYDIVSNSADHTTLKAAVDACGLDGVLSGSGPFTLFAPTDAAFNALPSGTVAALLNNLPQLTDILKHHVVADSVMSGMLSNNQVVTTLLGTDVTVTISNGMVYIDNAMVTVADIVADNGVVHVIDAVLLPNFDCNGIVNGSSMIDTCGVCQQSYIYNYVTHAVTMLNDTFNVTLGSNEILVIANDPSNPYWNSSCVSNSIYDIVSNSADHTTLKAAVDVCGLDGVLSGSGPFTLFAPTDAAFNALPSGTVAALLNNLPQLTDILKHHVVADSVMSGMLSNNQVVTTLLGTDVTVTISNGMVYIDNAMVTVADIVADNGVVHVIDAVLLPTVNISIYDIVSNSPEHTTLKTAIDACGLDGVLKGAGPFTLFAPTDAAFNALPSGTVAALLNNLPQLTDILKHHVVADSVMSGMLSNNQVVTTLLGTDVTVTISNGLVYIDNAMVTVADIVADNGVVHIIDAVLLPTTTDIQENIDNEKVYLYSLNILGEKVNKDIKNQILFNIYSDGSIVKFINRK